MFMEPLESRTHLSITRPPTPGIGATPPIGVSASTNEQINVNMLSQDVGRFKAVVLNLTDLTNANASQTIVIDRNTFLSYATSFNWYSFDINSLAPGHHYAIDAVVVVSNSKHPIIDSLPSNFAYFDTNN